MDTQPADKEDGDVDEGDDDDEGDEVEEHRGVAEHSDGEAVDADAHMAGATEHAEAEQERNKSAGKSTILTADPIENRIDDDGVVDPKKAPIQIFQLTISLRDDWLHRGDALQDMDLQTYAEFIERRTKPIRGTDTKKMRG